MKEKIINIKEAQKLKQLQIYIDWYENEFIVEIDDTYKLRKISDWYKIASHYIEKGCKYYPAYTEEELFKNLEASHKSYSLSKNELENWYKYILSVWKWVFIWNTLIEVLKNQLIFEKIN